MGDVLVSRPDTGLNVEPKYGFLGLCRAPALSGRSRSDALSEVVLDGLLPFDPRWRVDRRDDRPAVGDEHRESDFQGDRGLWLGERLTAAA